MYRWIHKETPHSDSIQQLQQTLNIDEIIASLLLQRSINSFEGAKSFFRPNLDLVHDPFLMKGMNLAVQRISTAIENKQQIMVYGDYDVDGTTAVALVYQFLQKLTSNIEYYIPDRYTEGYGISNKGIDVAEENGVSLIIALDCGIRSTDKIEYAKQKGIDFIICDHHLPGEKLPAAIAVLDPKQLYCTYPYKELTGCGIGFKLCQALCLSKGIDTSEVLQYLDLVAISIGADIVPITGENRIFAFWGLVSINSKPREGIKSILQFNNIRKKLSINDVVFIIAPRINAAGRIAHGNIAVKLLISPDQLSAAEFNQIIHYNNIERKNLDSNITQEALEMVAANEDLLSAKSTVLFSPSWHKGVVGIVASRVIEKYHRPTIILTESNGKITGSARSVRNFDIYKAISSCSHLLEQYGGHKYAAGITLKPENLNAFRIKFEEVVKNTISMDLLTPSIEIDLEISMEHITPKLMRILKQMEPFGPENMSPVFLSRNLILKNEPRIVGQNHLKLEVFHPSQENIVFQAIFFKSLEYMSFFQAGNAFDLVYSIDENEFNNQTNLQLVVKDVKAAKSEK